MSKKDIHAQIRLQIKALLKAKGKSAEKLAYEIGLSKVFIYAYLRGKSKAGVESLQKIADGLEVPIRELFPID